MSKVYLKNWLAFKVIIDSAIEDTVGGIEKLESEYFIEKFERYILTNNPEEYKWGIHPSLRAKYPELKGD